MLREFLSIFRTQDPLKAMADDFARMLTQTYEMTRVAGDIYFAGAATTEERRRIYEQDIEVNMLERRIRKAVIAHVSMGTNAPDLPYCLFLFSLVKDVERLGDYAKNLTEVMDIRPGPLPEDEIRAELESVRREVDATFRVAGDIVSRGDREQARQLTEGGRKLAKRCEATMRRIAAADYDSNTAVAAVLGARYYKRIGGHLTNVLTSVFMPLHKLDYFDEDELGKGGRPPA
jgi:phosphate uptake regulator